MTFEPESIGEYIAIDRLVPHPDNPRQNDHAIDLVAGSIKRFGFASPIIVRKEDSVIIAGHTRWKAAKQLGLDKVPVRFMDLDPVDAKLLMLADNKIGERADWDDDQLQNLFDELKDEDLTGLGWGEDELSDLLEGMYSEEEQEEPVTKPPAIESDFEFTLLKGDCLEKLKELKSNSIDSIVTDPPYEIGFMGKGWDDSGIAFNVKLWNECWRILKPGGHLIAFSSTRTVHPMGVAIAEARFEIRDMISWLYFSGFPKSHSVGKNIDTPEAAKWDGWGTALKPSYEPAILARKPLDKNLSIAENVLKWGTGGLNIDGCRFAYGDPCWVGPNDDCSDSWDNQKTNNIGMKSGNVYTKIRGNVDLTPFKPENGRWPANIYQCMKASRSEREAGLEHLQGKSGFEAVDRNEGTAALDSPRTGAGRTAEHVKNFHPTVKPIGIMRWLCRLVTPPGGTVLDPFLGSGTTAVAACLEGFNAVGCEMTEEYYPIIDGRIEWAKKEKQNNE